MYSICKKNLEIDATLRAESNESNYYMIKYSNAIVIML